MRARLFAICLPVVLALGGCGSPRTVAVEGEVTLDGKAVEEGEIAFLPTGEHKGPATGGAIVKGKYHIAAKVGPLVGGSYQVKITAMAPSGRMVPNPMNPQGPLVPYRESYIPARYNEKSELVFEVPSGKSSVTKHFKLEKAPQ